MRRFWILLGVLPLAGCATSATAPEPRQFAGYFSSGFETESFRPCDSDEQWWVTDATGLRAEYARVAARPYDEVYVTVRGDAGPEGRYGHLGAYQRELRVTEVLTIRPPRQGDCE